MSTKNESPYDQIGRRFGLMKNMPISMVVKASVENLLGSLEGQTCLDLACGLGDYAHVLSAYGAKSVVGVDISEKMVEAAQQDSHEPNDKFVINPSDSLKTTSNLTFRTGDCLKAVKHYDPDLEEPFDVVLACWLLNYAPDRKSLLETWKGVALNLKPGGRFIGVVPHLSRTYKSLPGGTWAMPELGMNVTYLEDVPDGEKTRVTSIIPPEKGGPDVVEFDNYKLGKGVYELTAKEAGMKDIRYGKPALPNDGIDGQKVPDWWGDFLASSHFDIIIATV